MNSGARERVPRKECEKHAELQGEREEVRNRGRRGNDEAGKIHLPEKMRVRGEGRCSGRDILREVLPRKERAEIEQQRGNLTGRDARHFVKSNAHDERCEKWLEHEPDRAQYRLFILREEVPPHKYVEEIPVFPKFLPVYAQPALGRREAVYFNVLATIVC